MDEQEKDKKEYELALLLKSEADLAGVLAFVGKNGGEVLGEPRAKALNLAYEVKGVTDGVFAYCNFKSASADAKELERELNTRQDVLRFMIIATPPPAEKSVLGAMPRERRGKPMRAPSGAGMDAKPAASHPLSNEALEKKIEEILK